MQAKSIRRLRRRYRLTQREVAEVLRRSPSWVSAVEHSRIKLDKDELIEMAARIVSIGTSSED